MVELASLDDEVYRDGALTSGEDDERVHLEGADRVATGVGNLRDTGDGAGGSGDIRRGCATNAGEQLPRQRLLQHSLGGRLIDWPQPDRHILGELDEHAARTNDDHGAEQRVV